MSSYHVSIGNSECLLTPTLDASHLQDLDRLLSFEKPGAYFSKLPFWAKREHLLVKAPKTVSGHLFPTGLLHVVLAYFNYAKVEVVTADLRQRPKSKVTYRVLNRKTLPPLRSYQEKIIDLCIEAERGVVESATGTGKTRCVVELIGRLNLTTLVVVPSTVILGQTYAILCDSYSKKLVGKVGDGKAQWDKSITVANYQSLEKAPPEFWNKLDVVIMDEFHHSSCNTIQHINKVKFPKVYYRFGFTATNFRSDGTDLALQGVLSDVIFRYNAADAVIDGVLCPPVFCVYDFFHDASLQFVDRWVEALDDDGQPILRPDGTPKLKKESAWRQEYGTRIVNNETYHEAVAKVAKHALSQDLATIVFVNEIEHGEQLAQLIPGGVFVNGTNPSKENRESIKAFNEGKLNCLIGTSVIGEGVDLVRAACGIMAGGGKSTVETTQRVGRMLRTCAGKKFALVVDFMHHDSKYPLRHSSQRMSVYKTFKTKIELKDKLPQ